MQPLIATTTQHTTAQSMHTAITVGKTQLWESVATTATGSGSDVSEFKVMKRKVIGYLPQMNILIP